MRPFQTYARRQRDVKGQLLPLCKRLSHKAQLARTARIVRRQGREA